MVQMLFNIVLACGVVAMLVLCIYMGNMMHKKEHFFFIMVVLFTGLILLGSLLEYNAIDFGAVLTSRKIEYMGNCFAEWFFLLFLLEHFGYKHPKPLLFSLFSLHMLCYAAIFTTEKTRFFYSEMKFVIYDGVGKLETTAAAMAYVHRAVMVFYMLAFPTVCLQHFFKHKTDKRRRHALYLAGGALLPSIGYIAMLSGVSGRYDFTPLLFGVSMILGYVVVFNGHMFDTVDIARDNLIASMEDAVIVMDSELHVLYMNQKSKELFPDINVNLETYNVVANLCKNTVSQYKTNNKKFNLKISNIYNKDKIGGYTLVFSDVTELVDYADELEQKVNDKVSEIERIQQHVLMSFANMIEMRDGMTGQHVKRTTEYVKVLAKELYKRGMYSDVLTKKRVNIISRAAALHDVGKIAISDMILQKPGKLTEDEFETIKTHSEMGGSLINEVLNDVGENEYLQVAGVMANYHHEKWNGEGYPEGLKGEEIPVEARIMAIADVFDALISKRQYKEAFSLDKAFEIIEESKGSHFDPDMAEVFIEIRPKIEEVVSELKDEE